MFRNFAQVENIMGLFFVRWNQRKYADLQELFWAENPVVVLPDEKKHLNGIEEIGEYINELEQRSIFSVHFPHSTYFEQTADDEIRGEWETLAFHVEEEKNITRYLTTHISVDFVKIKNVWRIKKCGGEIFFV